VQNRGRGGAMLTSNEVVLLMLGVVTSLPLLSIKECDHESADRQTDRQTQVVTEILSHAVCYS